MNTALIFTFSNNVDIYINSILHLGDKYAVSKFSFIFVTGATIEGPSTDFADKIVSGLEDLSAGIYKNSSIEIDDRIKSRCAATVDNLKASQSNQELAQPVPLEELEKFLERQSKQARPGRLFIDVTGLPKVLMSHVMLIGIAGGHETYAFELHKQPDRAHPEKSLYFFIPPGGFSYYPLRQSPAVQSVFRKLIHVRRILRTTTATLIVGIICFSILTFIDSQNPILATIGLVSNLIGIVSGIYQMRSPR